MRLLLLVPLLLVACGSRLTDAQALGQPHATMSLAAPDTPCRSVDLPAATLLTTVPSFPAPPSAMKRFYRDDGGWSVVYPQSWSVVDGRLRGAQLVSWLPNPLSGSSLVRPPDGTSLRIEAWPNDDRLGLDDWLAKNFIPAATPGSTNDVRSRTNTTLAGRPAIMVTAVERIGPPPYVETRIWWVASPYFDRVYRIQMTPSDLRLDDVQRVLSSFTMVPPTRTSAPIAVGPADAVSEVRPPRKNGVPSPTQVLGTKLVRTPEWQKAAGFSGYGMEDDPDRLFWLVNATGSFPLPDDLRGGGQAAPASPSGGYTQAVFLVDAHKATTPSIVWRGTGTDWPAEFAPIADRCVR